MSITKHYERLWTNRDCEILYSSLDAEIAKRAEELELDIDEVIRVLKVLIKECILVSELATLGVRITENEYLLPAND